MYPDPIILNLRLTHIREQVVSQLILRDEELNKYTRDAVEKALSTRNIADEIEQQVNKTITEAVENIGQNYEVRRAIHKIVTDSLYTFSREKAASERPGEARSLKDHEFGRKRK